MTKTTTVEQSANSPSHYAYVVRERKSGKTAWTRIGSAWQHADGKGFNVLVDAMPLDGRITFRVIAEAAK